MTELVQVKFSKIMQTRAYTMVILGTDEKRFPIYTESAVGQLLQLSLTEAEKPRPLTHDLMLNLMMGLDVRIKQVVINDLQDTTFFARLYIEQESEDLKHIVEIDARPSDCLTLALLNNVPVYCTREVFDSAIPVED